jgi:hypothetical protein
MEHVVFHPGPDGSPAFRRFASLEEAVRYVEHLRNSEGVSEVSVHALSPVPVSFRAYYKVEVPVDAPVAEVPAQPAPMEPVAMVEPVAEVPFPEPVPAPEPQLVEAPMAEAVAAAEQPSNGKRSLGFFAH